MTGSSLGSVAVLYTACMSTWVKQTAVKFPFKTTVLSRSRECERPSPGMSTLPGST
jgi:hypothetical protein